MKKSTTGLLLGSALVVGLSGCASSASQSASGASDRAWYQQPVVCGLAGGLIGGSIGYATSSESDEESGVAVGGASGAAIGALMCADRTPEPQPEPEPMPEPEPEPEFEPVVLESDVTFPFDSAELRTAAESELNQVARALRQSPEVRVVIAGHTDSIGTAEYNRDLSQRRAESVATYLQSRGIDGNRMRTIGYGEDRPVATNDTDAGRSQNRRVEINSQ
ncbi:OmpA family protein [Halomonas sp. TRM85114]|uniref:OmpA family protein n=1 Tax=Halomonas jincaotanensis TaxID=2810616 RepID=UPI001BD54032|nr:OmpA family protein [Halomonas jincaotanensis]MBS9405566.1 OmpA family protein [Halomonas jincaotanensis]